jgi:hypothetical protein
VDAFQFRRVEWAPQATGGLTTLRSRPNTSHPSAGGDRAQGASLGGFSQVRPDYHRLPLLTAVYHFPSHSLRENVSACIVRQKRITYMPVALTFDQDGHISRLKILVS